MPCYELIKGFLISSSLVISDIDLWYGASIFFKTVFFRFRHYCPGKSVARGRGEDGMAFSLQPSGFGHGASGPGTVDLQIWQALAPRQSGADHGYQVAPGIETPVVICPVSPGQTVHLMARKTFQYVSRSDIAVHVAALGFELATRALAV